MSIPEKKNNRAPFTKRQGEFLAFIYYYTRVNKVPPAEADIQRYFGISSASTHQMLTTLKNHQLLEKVPRKPRSMKILVPMESLPTEW